jgi:hypothetical protein
MTNFRFEKFLLIDVVQFQSRRDGRIVVENYGCKTKSRRDDMVCALKSMTPLRGYLSILVESIIIPLLRSFCATPAVKSKQGYAESIPVDGCSK